MNALLDRLSFRTAGESHGPAIVAIVEGLPRGLPLDVAAIDAQLRRRQGGAGRGGQQRIEDDRVEVLGGVRKGRTIGSPLCLLVRNRDHTIDSLPEPSRPRPGHADLAGAYRWLDADIRSTLERASARETCGRVAAGAVCAQLLAAAGCDVFGFVRAVHGAALPEALPGRLDRAAIAAACARRDATRLYTLDESADRAMLERVQEAGRRGDTVGGVVEVHAVGVLPGLGSCLQWNERLDTRIAAALASVPAIKGVEIGEGFAAAARFGSEVHDAILPRAPAAAGASAATGAGEEAAPFARATNRAGGIEGGMTNGEAVVVRAAMKPIATLTEPLPSVDLATGGAAPAGHERSDLCAVSACSVVAEAMVAIVLADALLARCGGVSLVETLQRVDVHRRALVALGRAAPEKGSSSP